MTVHNNPYKTGTQKWRILEVLKDLQWHCSEHELAGSQPAKALQGLRQDGFDLERVGVNWEKRMFCKTCERVTPHRRLKSLVRQDVHVDRVVLPQVLRARILQHYGGKDEILGYPPTGRAIEIDHRVPQIRWDRPEAELGDDATEEELEERYMLLVREHNLLKSRNCEKCKLTGQRQALLGVHFFFQGEEQYEDSLGCVGCGWHNPRKWKEELNKLVNIGRK